MMEDRPPLTSPDGSSNRNPPERCPRPLYSRVSTRGHRKIPQEDQCGNIINFKVEVKEEPEDLYVRSYEIHKDPGDTRDPQRDVKAEEEAEGRVRIKEEEIPREISSDTRDPQRDVKAEEEEDGHGRIKEEELPLDMSTGSSIFYSNFDTSDHKRSVSRIEELEIVYFNDSVSAASSDEGSIPSVHIDDESEEEQHYPSSVSSDDDDEVYTNLRKRHSEKYFPEGSEEPPAFPILAPKKRRVRESEILEGDNLVGHTRWCACGRCMPMPTADECRCCVSLPEVQPFLEPGMKCITEATEFQERCLTEKTLFYQMQCMTSISQKDYIKDGNRCYRRGAYKVYTYMVHGFPARNKRIPIPSCVVWTARHKYPDPNADYLGFQWPFDYNASDMALE